MKKKQQNVAKKEVRLWLFLPALSTTHLLENMAIGIHPFSTNTHSVSFAVWNGAIYQAESSGLDAGAREFSQSELNNICSELSIHREKTKIRLFLRQWILRNSLIDEQTG